MGSGSLGSVMISAFGGLSFLFLNNLTIFDIFWMSLLNLAALNLFRSKEMFLFYNYCFLFLIIAKIHHKLRILEHFYFCKIFPVWKNVVGK